MTTSDYGSRVNRTWVVNSRPLGLVMGMVRRWAVEEIGGGGYWRVGAGRPDARPRPVAY
jgi:hypothetical protein